MPTKQATRGKLSLLMGELSSFSRANPIALFATVAVIGGLIGLTKLTADAIHQNMNDQSGRVANKNKKELEERLKRLKTRLKIEEGGGSAWERTKYFMLNGTSNKYKVQQTKGLIRATQRAIKRIDKKNSTKLIKRESKKAVAPNTKDREFQTKEKLVLGTLPTIQDRTFKTQEIVEKTDAPNTKDREFQTKEKLVLGTLPTIQDRTFKTQEIVEKTDVPNTKTTNSFLSSIAPTKKEITNNKEVQINAPINITVNHTGEVNAKELAYTVKEHIKRLEERSKNNNVSHLDEEI